MKERKTVHVQARGETCNTTIESHQRGRTNDMYIADCCRFFAMRKPVIFISGDVNLQTTVESINTDSVSRGAYSSSGLSTDSERASQRNYSRTS